jgi:hypothetical protein
LPRFAEIMMIVCLVAAPASSFSNLYTSKIPYGHQITGEPERLRIREMISFLKSEMNSGDKLFHISRRTLLSFEFEWPELGLQNYWAAESYENYPQPQYWVHSLLKSGLISNHLHSGDRFWAVLCNWSEDANDPLITGTRDWLRQRSVLLRQVNEFAPVILEYYEFRGVSTGLGLFRSNNSTSTPWKRTISRS